MGVGEIFVFFFLMLCLFNGGFEDDWVEGVFSCRFWFL